jgi:1,4-alpha-glucan branching enzyme
VSPNGTTSLLSADDLYLFGEGSHTRLYRHLGAHLMERDGVAGAQVAVWAPYAEGVAFIGDANDWDDAGDPLVRRATSGVWEGFVPGAAHGQAYKLNVLPAGGGDPVQHADPFATHTETPPGNASKLWDLAYAWDDDIWMRDREARQTDASPFAIYELHLGSWQRGEDGKRFLTYRELAPHLIDHLTALHVTHVELLPVMEHPFYGSWGYQTTGYFAPTSRYGTPQDLMWLIDQLHQAGIGVILDFVPSHFPDDWWGLARFDGTHLYDHEDPRRGIHPDWNSAMFNYGRPEVRSFLLSSALAWLDRYHADGLRVDAVSSMLYLDYSRGPGEWIPNEHGGNEHLEAIDLLRRFNDEVAANYPGVWTFAEESTAWPGVTHPTYAGGLGFNAKWDLGWMHDSLSYLAEDPINRRAQHHQLTFRSVYAMSEMFCLPLSHDEVSHGKGSLLDKMPGDDWQQRANLRLLLGHQVATPGKKLVFMGAESGQRGDWDVEGQLDWPLLNDPRHAAIMTWTSELLAAYREYPALHARDNDPDGFAWVDASDEAQSIVSYLRRSPDADDVLVVCNFTPVPRSPYRIGVPESGFWRVVLNSDDARYGGSGAGNDRGLLASPHAVQGHAQSVDLTLPPLSIQFFTPQRDR